MPTTLFLDDFDGPAGTSVNRARWGFDTGSHGFGGNEEQTHTDSLKNCSLDGAGHLRMVALKESVGGKLYTSPRLNSSRGTSPFLMHYGFLEAKIKMPIGGLGVLPSLWLGAYGGHPYVWPRDGEIDLFEYKTYYKTLLQTLISVVPNTNTEKYEQDTDYVGHDLSSDFHLYQLDWREQEITWLVDGVETKRETPSTFGGRWAFTHPFWIILSLPLGRFDKVNASTVFPQTMLVDYIKVTSGAIVVPVPDPLPPGGEMPEFPSVRFGKETFARSPSWKEEADTLYSNVPGWVEYTLNLTTDVLYVKLANHGELPLPPDYVFTIQVQVNGVVTDMLKVPVNALSTALVPITPQATVRLTWQNDAYRPGVYDANLWLLEVGSLPVGQPPTTPPVLKAYTAKATVSMNFVAELQSFSQEEADATLEAMVKKLAMVSLP